jgi:hypothetical protein
VMRLMPALVIEEDEIDFLLAGLRGAIEDLLSGAGPEESAPERPRRRPARATGATGATSSSS